MSIALKALAEESQNLIDTDDNKYKGGIKVKDTSSAISVINPSGDYGSGFVPELHDIYGSLQKHKADTQSDWEKFAYVFGRGIPKAAMSIVEPLGHLLDIEQYTSDVNQVEEDYGNWFNQLLQSGSDKLDKAMPIYTADDQPTIMSKDWWFKNGDQVLKSVGYFVPGMAMTKGASVLLKAMGAATKLTKGISAVGRGSGALANIAKTGDIAGKANRVLSPLIGATAQNYSEHMLSATQAFKENKEAYYIQNKKNGMSEEAANTDAKLRASEDAEGIIVGGKFNIIFNTIEYSNLFRAMNSTRRASGMTRQAMAKTMLGTAASEYAEEVTTGFLETEARRKMQIATGQIQEDGSSGADRYITHLGSYEGLTEGILGAVGGAGMQTISNLTNRSDRAKQREQIQDNIAALGNPTEADKGVFNTMEKNNFYELVYPNLEAGTMEDVYKRLDSFKNLTPDQAKELKLSDDYIEKAEEYTLAAKELETDYNLTNDKYKGDPIIASSIIRNKVIEREATNDSKFYDKSINELNNDYTQTDKKHPLFNTKQKVLDSNAIAAELQSNDALLKTLPDPAQTTVITNENAQEIEARSEELYKEREDINTDIQKDIDSYVSSNAIKNKAGEITEHKSNKATKKAMDYLYVGKEVTDPTTGTKGVSYSPNITSKIDEKMANLKYMNRSAVSRRNSAHKLINDLETNPETRDAYRIRLDKLTKDKQANDVKAFKAKVKDNTEKELKAELRNTTNVEMKEHLKTKIAEKRKNTETGSFKDKLNASINTAKYELKNVADKLTKNKDSKSAPDTPTEASAEASKVATDFATLQAMEGKMEEQKQADIARSKEEAQADKENEDAAFSKEDKPADAKTSKRINRVPTAEEEEAIAMSNKGSREATGKGKRKKGKLPSSAMNETDKVEASKQVSKNQEQPPSSTSSFDYTGKKKHTAKTNKAAIVETSDNANVDTNPQTALETPDTKSEVSDQEEHNSNLAFSINIVVSDNGEQQQVDNGRIVRVGKLIVHGSNAVASSYVSYDDVIIKDSKGNDVVTSITNSNTRNGDFNKLLETGEIGEGSNIRISVNTKYKLTENGEVVDSYDMRKDDDNTIPYMIEVEVGNGTGNWVYMGAVHDPSWIVHYTDGKPDLKNNDVQANKVIPSYTVEGEYVNNAEEQHDNILQIRKNIKAKLATDKYINGTIDSASGGTLTPNILIKDGKAVLDNKNNPIKVRDIVANLMPGLNKIGIITKGKIIYGSAEGQFIDITTSKYKSFVDYVDEYNLYGKPVGIALDANDSDLIIPFTSSRISNSSLIGDSLNGSLQNYFELAYSNNREDEITAVNNSAKQVLIDINNIQSIKDYLSNYLYIRDETQLDGDKKTVEIAIDNLGTLTIVNNKTGRLLKAEITNEGVKYSQQEGATRPFMPVDYNRFKDIVTELLKFAYLNTNIAQLNNSDTFNEHILYSKDGTTIELEKTNKHDSYRDYIKTKLYTKHRGTEYVDIKKDGKTERRHLYTSQPVYQYNIDGSSVVAKDDKITNVEVKPKDDNISKKDNDDISNIAFSPVRVISSTISDEEVTALNNSIPDIMNYVIPELGNFSTQVDIVNYIVADINNAYEAHLNKGEHTNTFKVSEAITTAKANFEKRLASMKQVKHHADLHTLEYVNGRNVDVRALGLTTIEQVDNVLTTYDNILNDKNWNKLVTHTTLQLESKGFKINTTDYTVIEVEGEDSTYEAIKFNEDAMLKLDPKDKATPRFKLWLSQFNKVVKYEDGQPVKAMNVIALPRLIDVDILFNTILDVTSNAGLNKQQLLKALRDNSRIEPTFNLIADKLESDTGSIMTEFINIMARARYNLVKLSITNRYNRAGNIIGINNNMLYNNARRNHLGVLEDWAHFQKDLDIVDFTKAVPTFIKHRIDTIKAKYDRLYIDNLDLINNGEFTKDFRNGIYKIFKELGLNVNTETFRAIFNNPTSINTVLNTDVNSAINPTVKTGMMGSIFEAFNTDEEIDITIHNPIFNEISRMYLVRIGNLQAKLETRYYSNSTLNSEGDIIQETQNYTSESNNVRRLKDINDGYADQVMSTSFGANSILAKMFTHSVDGQANRDAFNISYFDATSYSQNKSYSRSSMSPSLQNQTALGLFQNNGKDLARYIGLTNGDSKIVPLYSFPKFDINPNITNNNIEFIGNKAVDLLHTQALNEINRITKFQEQIKTSPYAEYNIGAGTFFLFPYLNERSMKQAVKNNIITDTELKSVWINGNLVVQEEGHNVIKKLIEHDTLQEINRLTNDFIEEGIISRINDNGIVRYENKLMDYRYINGLKYNSSNAVLYAMLDFYINDTVMRNEQYILLKGDPAAFAKGTYSNVNMEATIDSVTKRLKQSVSPFVTPNNEHSPIVNIVTVDDINMMIDLGTGTPINSDITDGAEVITLLEKINFMKSYNNITDKMYDSIKAKIDNAKTTGNYDYQLTGDELAVITSMDKPMIRDMILDTKHDVRIPFNRKSGAITLHPNMTRNTKLDKLRIAMEEQDVDRLGFNSTDKSGKYNANVDVIFNKNGELKEDIVFNNIRGLDRNNAGLQVEMPTGKSEIATVSQMNLLVGNNIRHIDGIAAKLARKAEIKIALYELGKQEVLTKLDITERNKEFIYSENTIAKIQQLIIDEANSNSKWSIPDIQQLTVNKEGGELVFDFPLITNNSYQNIESLLNSVINSTVIKTKLPGLGLTQTPDIGYTPTKVISESEYTGQIIYTNSYSVDNGLQHINNTDNNRSQILIAWQFKDNRGKLLNIENYIVDGKIDITLLPQDMLENISARIPNQDHSSMLPYEIVGFLPNVMGNSVVVANEIPAQMGSDFDIDKLYAYLNNYYIHPTTKAFVKLNREHGIDKIISDLDTNRTEHKKALDTIEKKRKESTTSKDAKQDGVTYNQDAKDVQLLIDNIDKELKAWEYINSNVATERNMRNSEYMDIINDILTNDEVAKVITQPLDNDNIGREVREHGTTTDIKISSWLHHRDSYKAQRDGQALISNGAIYNLFNAVIQEFNDIHLTKVEDSKIIDVSIDIKSDITNGGTIKLEYIGGVGESTTVYSKDDIVKNSISQNIGDFLNLFVDNSNNSGAGKININRNTIGAVLFSQLLRSANNKSMSSAFIIRLINQPIVLDYVKELEHILSDGSSDIATAKKEAIDRVRVKYNHKFSNKYSTTLSAISLADTLTSKSIDDKFQNTVLNLFAELDKFSNELSPILTVSLYGYRNGASTSLADVKEIIYKYNYNYFNADKGANIGISNAKPFTNISFSNVAQILGTIRGKTLTLNTELGSAFKNSTLLADNIYSPLFNLDNNILDALFNRYRYLSGKDVISAKQIKEIISAHRSNMFSGTASIFTDTDINSERNRLWFGDVDNKSLVGRYYDIVLKYPNNQFLQKLRIIKGKNNAAPSLLAYDNSKGKNIHDVDNMQHLNSMLESKDDELALFAEDLITYSYLTSGIFNPISFTRYISSDYLKSIGFDDRLRDIVSNVDNATYINRLIRQMVQHKPWLSTTISNVGKSDNNKDYNIKLGKDNNPNVITINYRKSNVFGDFLSINHTENGWMLFERVDDITYNRINLLGSATNAGKYTSEYNMYIDEQRSIIDSNKIEDYIETNTKTINTKSKELTPEVLNNAGWVTKYFADNKGYIETVLDNVEETEYNKTLANILSSYINKYIPKVVTAKAIDKGDTGIAGTYNEDTKTIELNTIGFKEEYNRNKRVETTTIHEAIHAVTLRDAILSNTIKGRTQLKSENIRRHKILENINKARVFAVTHLNKQGNEHILKGIRKKLKDARRDPDVKIELTPIERDYYGLADNAEFIAEILTNIDFQKAMNNIPYSGNKSTLDKVIALLTNLIKTIATELGIIVKTDSVLEVGLSNTLDLITDVENIDVTFKAEIKENTTIVGEKNIEGVNISSYEVGLGSDLSNFAKIDVIYKRDAPFNSSEQAYQYYKRKLPNLSNSNVEALMVDILTAKLTQHPNLITNIDNKGGLAYLKLSTHNLIKGNRIIKNDRWTGKDGLFMKSLRKAYANIKGISYTDDKSQQTLFSPNPNQLSIYDNAKHVAVDKELEFTNVKASIISDLLTNNMIKEVNGKYYIEDKRIKPTDLDNKPDNMLIEIFHMKQLLYFNENVTHGAYVVELRGTEVVIKDNGIQEYIDIEKDIISSSNKAMSPMSSTKAQLSPEARGIFNVLTDRLNSIESQITPRLATLQPLRYNELIKTKESITTDINRLTHDQSINSIKTIANKQLDYVNYSLDNNNPTVDELDTLYNILDVWKYSNSVNFLTEDEQDNQYHEFHEALLNINTRVTALHERLNILAPKLALESIKRVTGKNAPKVTTDTVSKLSEIGAGNAYLRGLSVTNQLVVQTFDHVLRNAAKNQTGIMQDFTTKVTGMVNNLKRSNDYKGNYDFMFQRDDEGNIMNSMVNELSWRWDSFQVQLNRNEQINNYDYFQRDVPISTDQYTRKVKELDNKLINNAIVIDVAAAGIAYSDGKYTPRKIDGVLYTSIKQYKDYLIEELGEEDANKAIEDAKHKYNQFLTKLDEFKTLINNDDSLTADEKEDRIDTFRIENSPIVYSEHLFGNKPQININRTNANTYTTVVPRRKFKSGKDSEYYDKQYVELSKSKDLMKFYNDYSNLMTTFLSMLPENTTKDLPANFLAQVQRSTLSMLNDIGVKEVGKHLTEDMMNSITTGEIATLAKAEGREARDANSKTSKEYKNPKIRHINGISDEARVSKDLEQNLLLFGKMAINYEFMNDVRNEVNNLKNVILNAKTIKKDKSGNPIIVDGVVQTVESSHELLKKVVLHNQDAVMFADKTDTDTPTNHIIYSFNPHTNYKKKNQAINIKLENDRLEAEREELLDNQDKYDSATFDQELNRIDESIRILEVNYKELGGKALSMINVGNVLMKITQLKGLGFNITAGAANLLFGFISNITHANGRVDFTTGQYMKAVGILMKNRGSRKTSKAFNIISKMNILFDVIDTRYDKTGDGKATIKILNMIDPFIFQTKTEYVNQTTAGIAVMLNTPIVDKKGNTTNVYDAMEEDGTLSLDKFTQEQVDDWQSRTTATTNNKFTKVRNHIIQLNTKLHGNYDPESPIFIKRALLGRMLLQFRTWLPETVASRFEGARYDLLLDREVKGRWTTYKELGLFKSITTLAKQIMYRNNAFINNGYDMKPVDIENMRKNLAELGIFTSFMATLLLFKLSLDDDDDDKLNFSIARVLYNVLVRGEQDILLYAHPATFYDVVRDPIPVTGLILDIGNAWTGTWRYAFDDNYKGQHPGMKWMRTAPYFNQVPKIHALGTRYFK